MSFSNISAHTKDIFVKSFPNLMEDDVQMLFDHAREVETALTNELDTVFPHVIERKNKAIHYAYLHLQHPMLDRVQSFSCTTEQLERVGSLLKCLHNVRRASDGASLLHSDYVPHNFFLDDNKFILIDPHPPHNLPFSADQLYGPPLDEVVGFLFCLLSDAGFRRCLSRLKYKIMLTRSFLDGYGRNGISLPRFLAPLLRYMKGIYCQKRTANFPVLHTIMHCVVGGAMTLYIIRRGL